MSFRRAYLLLFIFLLVVSLLAFALYYGQRIDAPAYLAFLAVFVAIYLLIVPALSQQKNAVEFVQRLFGGQPQEAAPPWDVDSPEDLHARQDVLSILHHNVLQPRLHDRLAEMAHITLRLQPSAAYQGRSLPTDHKIGDLFTDSGRLLLILGEPGSGKTFTLLRLCRDLVPAPEDPHSPLPVILDLASWAQEKPPLPEWIADRMQRDYRLGKRVTPAWLQHSRLALLLDGLDELPEPDRVACVRAINNYRAGSHLPIAIASRAAEYHQLAEQLDNFAGYTLLPIDVAELDRFLSEPAHDLAAVREAVHQDQTLSDLARTPLFLYLIAITYRGLDSSDLQPLLSGTDPASRRAHLYNHFIPRAFADHPLTGVHYDLAQSLRWLRYLAHKLTAHKLSNFYFEDLRPDWLPAPSQSSFRAYAALPVGIIFGLFAFVYFTIFLGLTFGALLGLIFASLSWYLYRSESSLKTEPTRVLLIRRPGWRQVCIGVLVGLLAGLVIGLIYGLLFTPAVGLLGGVTYGLIAVLLGGIMSGLRIVAIQTGISSPTTHLNEGVRWLGHSALISCTIACLLTILVGAFLVEPLIWIVAGLVIGLIAFLWVTLSVRSRFDYLYGILAAIAAIIIVGLFFVTVGRLMSEFYVALLLEFLPASIAPRLSWFLLERDLATVSGLFRYVLVWLLMGIGVGLLAAIALGLGAFLDHWTLRLLLGRDNLLPLRLAPFLNHMSRRHLLQFAGSHFRFLHPTFQQHIGALTDEEITSLAAAVSLAFGAHA